MMDWEREKAAGAGHTHGLQNEIVLLGDFKDDVSIWRPGSAIAIVWVCWVAAPWLHKVLW